MNEIAGSSQGRVGAAVLLLESGKSAEINGDERFPMQSVYKLPIAMAVLDRVDRGSLKLEQKVKVQKSELVPDALQSPLRDKYPQGDVELPLRELLHYNVSESDGTACDVLLRIIGGPQEVSKYLREIGIKELIVADTEMEMSKSDTVQYRNWATPKGAIALLKLLHEGKVLSAQSHELLTKLMIETPTGLKRIKGLLPNGTIVAHKTGTSGTVNGITAATNDIGIITLPNGKHLAVAVFVSDAKAGREIREGVIARIAKAAYDVFLQ
ncbi:MAG TPA: class A beta-lactamase, subclass A2 [Blastocatellia bacterium]|nr:class A beta-lactamase, subclass A2 [Blastocatellia bacterium]